MKCPSVTFYTDRLPDGVGGDAHGPVVRIRPIYRNDVGIHQHEQTHVNQWWIVGLVSAALLALISPVLSPLGIGTHPLLYATVRRYRLWAEV